MTKKPHLSFWQIWNMSVGFFGIQFGFALQNANVSRIFQTLGAEIGNLSILWVAAPVTGLLVQPIIGHYSDKTWSRLGRRRPYFLAGALLASLALLVMPHSSVLWMAAGMLWILDASINVSMEPFRAFVGDMLPDEQRTRGFAMQSFFIGTGAVIASVLPWVMTNWLHISNTAPEGVIPPSVRWSFYIGGVIYFISVLWTIITTKEYTPEQLDSFNEVDIQKQEAVETIDFEAVMKKGKKQFVNGFFWLLAGAILTYWFYYDKLTKDLYVLSFGFIAFGVLMIISGGLQLKRSHKSALVVIMNDMFSMPKTMWQLAFVQFFSWFALFAMWIYTTPAITQYVFHSSDTASAAYNNGADWVSILFAVYNGFAALVAWFLTPMARLTNRKITHSISLILGGLGLLSIYFIKDQYLLLVSMLGVGVAWASILSIPYAILTNALPHDKMGIYMGIFNYFIVIPQIVAAAILGFFLDKFFHSDAVYALILGGISMFIAAALVLFVRDSQS
ncbi:MAG: MFS transporter [Bacteroidales bacterium]|nr:MFS transporter [Bacteroidales bacterium]